MGHYGLFPCVERENRLWNTTKTEFKDQLASSFKKLYFDKHVIFDMASRIELKNNETLFQLYFVPNFEPYAISIA